VNLSRLRYSKEQLSKGGYASGPVSFMRGADASAGTIKSGGKTRRAAKMVVLDVDHPDIEEFIWCKAHEEKKARVLEQAGYDMSLDSADWASIQYQNANNSVRVTDAFMEAVEADADWNLTARTDGAVVETVKAQALLKDMAEAAWQCADPAAALLERSGTSLHAEPPDLDAESRLCRGSAARRRRPGAPERQPDSCRGRVLGSAGEDRSAGQVVHPRRNPHVSSTAGTLERGPRRTHGTSRR